MAMLTCDICGANNLMKQDGVFVCQTCGTKYSVEEARKMMGGITEKVDISKNSTNDDANDELRNLYELARRAKDNNDGENAVKYYGMILLKAPSDWEANFYEVFFRAASCRIMDIPSAASNVSNSLGTVMRLIDQHCTDEDEKINAIEAVRMNSVSLATVMRDTAMNAWTEIDNTAVQVQYMPECFARLSAAANVEATVYNEFIAVFLNCEYIMVEYGVQMLKSRLAENRGMQDDDRARMVEAIRRYDINYIYVKPESTQSTQSKRTDSKTPSEGSSGGCYVATCVYGSYNCPEVWTLRRYRDDTLAATWYGRAFIHTYYAISPTIVKWFGGSNWFKKMWRGKLDRMVNRLNDAGVENTPYMDKTW